MSHSKQDKALVASAQYHELRYICNKFKIGVKELRAILLEIGQNGKPEHSRKEIYEALELRKYVKGGAKMVLPADTEAPVLPESKVYVNG